METKVRDYYLAEPERFWIKEVDASGYHRWTEVKGEPVQIPGMGEADLFLFHANDANDSWLVVEGATGHVMCDGEAYYWGTQLIGGVFGKEVRTRDEAIIAAIKNVAEKGYSDREKFRRDIGTAIAEMGLSPRYRFYEDDPCHESYPCFWRSCSSPWR